MKITHRRNVELRDLSIVLIVAMGTAFFSVSLNIMERLYALLQAYAYYPLIEFSIQMIFLLLAGLLWCTYRRWRCADKRQRELENVVDSISPDVLLVVDPERNIIRCNASVKRLFGYEVGEVIHRKTDILYSDRRADPRRPHEVFDALEREGFHVGLATGKEKDGRSKPLEIITGSLSGRGGAVLLLRDISDRQRAEEEIRDGYQKLQMLLEKTVNILALAVEMRDPYTAGHQRQVAKLACAIAQELGFPATRIDGLRLAAIVHDVGKLYVPAEILSKPGRLTETEFSLIKAHSQLGYDLLRKIDFPWPVAEMVLQHHERVNGSGYPQHLSGQQILPEALILGVADVVEAMSSHRPYRPAHGTGRALQEIAQQRCTLYDPQVVDACLRLFYEKNFAFDVIEENIALSEILMGRS